MWNVVCNINNRIDNEYHEIFLNLSKQGGRAVCEVWVEVVLLNNLLMDLHTLWHSALTCYKPVSKKTIDLKPFPPSNTLACNEIHHVNHFSSIFTGMVLSYSCRKYNSNFWVHWQYLITRPFKHTIFSAVLSHEPSCIQLPVFYKWNGIFSLFVRLYALSCPAHNNFVSSSTTLWVRTKPVPKSSRLGHCVCILQRHNKINVTELNLPYVNVANYKFLDIFSGPQLTTQQGSHMLQFFKDKWVPLQ